MIFGILCAKKTRGLERKPIGLFAIRTGFALSRALVWVTSTLFIGYFSWLSSYFFIYGPGSANIQTLQQRSLCNVRFQAATPSPKIEEPADSATLTTWATPGIVTVDDGNRRCIW